jgi:alkylation response protein AidB-like acyl-CoA dehydrogenase
MDFKLSDEQKMLREGAERYLAENYSFDRRRELLQREGGFSSGQWRHFADMGWLALTVPEEFGGLAGSLVDACVLLETFGRALVVEPFASTAILGAFLIEGCEVEALRNASLESLVAGDTRVALAHAEEETRYDLGKVVLRAQRTEGGYRLSGRKVGVWDSPSAQQLIVSAVLDGDSEFSLFLVPKPSRGVHEDCYRLIDSTQCADVVLDGAHAALLVPAPAALPRLEYAIDRLILARVAESLGIMERIMELTVEQLKSRSQFGQPLSKFQALQHRMAEMFVEVQDVRSILYAGLAYVGASPGERGRVVSMAKAVANNAGRIVGAQGIQLHGGVGMTDEYPVGHYFKRLISLEKQYGDDDYHLQRIARRYAAEMAR